MLFISIRKNDRPDRVQGNQGSRLDTRTRQVLGSGTWPNVPVYRDDSENG
jgi:hypothetical protein